MVFQRKFDFDQGNKLLTMHDMLHDQDVLAVLAQAVAPEITIVTNARDETLAARDEAVAVVASEAEKAWAAAWASDNIATLREFFATYTGPRTPITGDPVTGTVNITTQADAEALVGKEVQGGLVVNVAGIELHDFRLVGDGRSTLIDTLANAMDLYVHHVEVDGNQQPTTNSGIGVSTGGGPADMVVEWCNFHDLNDALLVRPRSSYRYNFVHTPLWWDAGAWGVYNAAEDPHTDGFQWYRGEDELVERNFVDLPYRSPSTTPNINACLIIKTDVAAIDGTVIRENYLNGGTRTVMVRDGGFGDPTNVTIADNRFGAEFNDGLWQLDEPAQVSFSGNTWAQTGLAVPTADGSFGYRLAPFPSEQDPLGFGCVMTQLGFPAAAAWGAANEARYVRALSGGRINGIEMHVTTQSGNVSVGVFRGVGRGLSRVPGERVSTSGAVACPTTGHQRIAIPEVVVEPGDFLAMSCDNTTASFLLFSGTASGLLRPLGGTSAASHPLPTSAPSPGSPGFRMPWLVGTYTPD